MQKPWLKKLLRKMEAKDFQLNRKNFINNFQFPTFCIIFVV
jgi:hypothetical protein